jgi:PIN domain nuclease of toxin-antitoxin system
MAYLLDTNQFIFALQSPTRLHVSVVTLLAQPATVLYLSVVSLWEVKLKSESQFASGESKLPLMQPLPLMLEYMLEKGVMLLTLEPAHIVVMLETSLKTNDPFDQLLLKQCQVEKMQLLTSNKRLLSHPLVAQVV